MSVKRFFFKDPDEPEDDGPPEFIASGEYIVQIIAWREKVTQVGVKFFEWELKVLDDLVHPEFRLWHITAQEGPGMWRMREFIQALTGREVMGEVGFDPDRAVSRIIGVKTENQQYMDKCRTRVKSVHTVTWNFQ